MNLLSKVSPFCVLLIAASALATSPPLGELSIAEFNFQSGLYYSKATSSDFELNNTGFAIQWRRDALMRAHILLGTPDLAPGYMFYGPGTGSGPEENFGLVEAYFESLGSLGGLRAGRIPLVLSYDSFVGRLETLDNRSWVLSSGWFPMQGLGVQYEAQTGPFMTQLSLFEGHPEAPLEESPWYSALWSFYNDSGFGILISALAGGWEPGSHLNVDSPIAFDTNEDGNLRQANFAIFNHGRVLDLLLETSLGKVIQGTADSDFGLTKLSLRYRQNSRITYTLISEQLSPDYDNKDKDQSRLSAKLSLFGQHRLSALEFLYRQNYPAKSAGATTPRDEFALVLRISSHQLL